MKWKIGWYYRSMGKRIGFILASAHEGTAPRMWKAAIKAVDTTSSALFIFPGGRLNYKGGDEYLKNSIYKLASSENVDGVISWTSSLTGKASNEEISEFFQPIVTTPAVSIGERLGASPLVDFDAYLGMAEEIRHFIKVHESRRIVFVRGPENHRSAEERFKAYIDVLKENNIELNPDLITSPRPWSEGKEALEELINNRGLVPGMDFDSIICASDLLLYGVCKHLEALGISVPQTVRVGGFNDSDTNKLLGFSVTTVRMPISGMASSALSILMDMIRSASSSGPDINLPADLIIRHSCGCLDAFAGGANNLNGVKDTAAFVKWTAAMCNGNPTVEAIKAFYDYIISIKDMSDAEKERFSHRFMQLSENFFSSGGECEDLIEVSRAIPLVFDLSDEFRVFYKEYIEVLILKSYSQYIGSNEYRSRNENKALGAFKIALLSTRSFEHLSEVFCSNLKIMGFEQAYLVLDTGDDCFMRLCAGYNIHHKDVEAEVFPSVKLLPSSLSNEIMNGAYITLPLASDNQALGYLVMQVNESCNELILEDIRASVSSAIKGIMLLETANKARDVAEKAERRSSEFYANISEELREPLEGLRKSAGCLPEEHKGEFLRDIVKAENLLDLILSEKGEVELNKELIDPSDFFSSCASSLSLLADIASDLPLLYADKERLKQVVEILTFLIRENDNVNPFLEVALRPDGLLLSFHAEGWNPSLLRNNPSLILAEKIVMMHSGTFRFREQGLSVIIPWPTLCGSIIPSSSIGYTMFIKHGDDSSMPEVLKALPQIVVVNEEELVQSFSIPDNICQIAYNAAGRKEGGSIVLNLLRNHQKTKSLPFLCFSLPPSSLDLWSALETSSARKGEAVIAVLGNLPPAMERFSSFGSFHLFDNKEALLASNAEAALIILNEADEMVINTLRRSSANGKAPILVIKDHFKSEEIEHIMQLPNLLVVNTCILESDEFLSRLIGIFGGNDILPPLTGALVKKAIAFLNAKATQQLSRWQLADSVNISEDYLTRIFRKDMGISPWDYLNRYRIQLSAELLVQTGLTINEIALRTGFQDQAYFCRVFKKIKGFPPGHLRSRK